MFIIEHDISFWIVYKTKLLKLRYILRIDDPIILLEANMV